MFSKIRRVTALAGSFGSGRRAQELFGVPELVAPLAVTGIFMRCLSVKCDFLRVSSFRLRVKRRAFRSFARPAKHNLCGHSWNSLSKAGRDIVESEDLTQVAYAKCQNDQKARTRAPEPCGSRTKLRMS